MARSISIDQPSDGEGYIEGVKVARHASTAIITLSNLASRNAFYPEMRRQLTSTLRDLGTATGVSAIIITGAHGHFCTGADLKRVAARAEPPTAMETRENMKEVLELFRQIRGGPRPVIAAVEGDAYGAGCSIALACDVVVTAPTARFGIAFTRIGLFPDMGMIYTLRERVGPTRARRMMMSGAVIDGRTAHDVGVADELVDDGDVLGRALEVAREFDAVAPIPVALIKAAMSADQSGIERAIETELDLVPLAASSEDAREGIAANRERRRPQFRGR